MHDFNPEGMAAVYRSMIREEIDSLQAQVNVAGFLVSDDPASATYARYTEDGCRDVGIHFNLQHMPREAIADAIRAANANPEIHGIFVYYPIFGDERDAAIKDMVDPRKDVEGLTSYWMDKLYRNERFDDAARQHRAILPCTPLAILKVLEATDAYSPGGLPFRDQVITVFNRSDVVGKPLAHMLANDGGTVYSFDVNGGVVIGNDHPIDRATALAQSDIVITGVPSRQFDKIRAEELKPGAICLNFSFVKNFEDAAREAARIYIPRVGPLTVAMCLRNATRLYRNYHA
ncbi:MULTISPECIES: bifunctional methylenetetrahydrofolate dehydrogenase/methenyltetrahydrofolate cyclohydrolase [unclassified Paludibacterium]|uniref:bifunctional methylenetetrahydrofolate dehydrogenase/methenyltetrahydrofolate cyclohydrolase n=1 Tax=unclassified Paludibacterium TaxID=2618429 RepID=UPI001C042853|nr:bifunctional methylenetetrahydrofolate dehydrogenase/methenyltetrahydrofolate cyclohydrolase [Paludibacterium sp. B53371]BEV71136.1 bifunctional methylenetetrahydrofolate dehydrogenase/methenyltetrahydrofolate cyclohydrolase [Paludibacterium sp. THUN1379]